MRRRPRKWISKTFRNCAQCQKQFMISSPAQLFCRARCRDTFYKTKTGVKSAADKLEVRTSLETLRRAWVGRPLGPTTGTDGVKGGGTVGSS